MRLWNWWKRIDSTPKRSDPDALRYAETMIDPQSLPEYRRRADNFGKLSDLDLVYVQGFAPSSGAAAELSRRSMEATRDLKATLDSANNRIYFLNIILTVYTAAL